MAVDQAGQSSPMTAAVRWLIAANVAVHFLQVVVFGPDNMLGALAFDAAVLPAGWWTLLTYMFVHAGLLHLALNLFVLWSFGPRLEETWGTRSFLVFYLWCGLGGAITHLALVGEGYLVGASASIYGLMLAYSILWKDDEIYLFGVLPVRARWLVVWLVGINLIYAVVALEGLTSIAAFAHLGGLIFAWIYLKGPGSGLARVRSHVSSVPDDTGDMPRVVPKRGRRARERDSVDDEIVAQSKMIAERQRLRALSGAEENAGPELNAVLDKISRAGINSLTADERLLLERLSRKLRKDDL